MITRFPTLRLEGGLISSDQIDRIADQKVKEFSIDDVAAAWSDILSYWTLFERSLAKLPEENLATSETRNRWMIPFFSTLGYELSSRNAAVVDGQTYAISHRAGKDENSPPIHIVGLRQSLDRRPESGRPRLAPHSLVQEYLNRTEHLWGIVTNGSTLRILRNSNLLRKQAYIEFDLEQIMKDELFADFALLYRLIHVSRMPRGIDDASSCLLEQYHQQTVELGGRVRDHLRDGVEKALVRFANGFLSHPRNTGLRAKVQDKSLEPFEYYQQLLRLIYRFLFLAVSEERNLITDNMPYRKHYSISRIRQLAEVRAAYTNQEDLWLGLATSFKLFQDEELGSLLSVPTLNGDLFDPVRTSEINDASLTNRDFLTAVWDICMYREKEAAPWRRINYGALDVEELGSVYESLLDFQPVFLTLNGKLTFDLLTGTERKSTGSYYTPPELVNELIQSALVPVIKDRLAPAKTPSEKEEALLSLTVCDPACGSGHFLLAAARTIGRELAKARTGDEEPAPEQMRIAIRDAITHCMYGVDKNPLAVDLCKVALWLEGHTKSKPLTFLDHRIRCGDSLVGVFDLSVLQDGIPDDAFTAVTGDDKAIARELKKQNKKERENRSLTSFDITISDLTNSRQQLNTIADDKPEDIQKKKEIFSAFQKEGTPWCRDKTACDLWTAAFFVGLTKEQVQNRHIPTTEVVREYITRGTRVDLPQVKIARQLASKYKFFHWPLEFPEVFIKDGFDCLLGNPPWEKIQPEEKTFFGRYDERVSSEKNSQKRQELIRIVISKNTKLQSLWNEFVRRSDQESKFISNCGRFNLSAKGNINYYRIFSDLARSIINNTSNAGIVIQSGLATDESSTDLLSDLMKKSQIISLFDFVNTKKIFNIHSSMKFSLLTITKKERVNKTSKFSFFNDDILDIKNQSKIVEIDFEDLKKINPNTMSIPTVKSRYDFELIKEIHRNSNILISDHKENSFNLSIWGEMFHMTRATKYYRDQIPTTSIIDYIPLNESKLLFIYDHRYASFERANFHDIVSGNAYELDDLEKVDPHKKITTRYFVPINDFQEKISRKRIVTDWVLGIRSIASPTNERTCIGAILPKQGVANSINLILYLSAIDASLLLSNLNSIICDFCARLKVGNQNLNTYIMKQLPIVITDYNQIKINEQTSHVQEILPRILELTYTAWDIKAFADDVWHDADDVMKALLRQQWEANKAATGGHVWEPPEWAEIEPDGIPLPPFKWNGDRRAVLRAELDALYAKLYGLSRDELRYILDPADVYGSDFPGETFRVLKEKEIKKYGEYQTRRLVLEAWDRMERVNET